MPEYLFRVGDLAPAYLTAHDDKAAEAMAWAMVHDDHRDGVQDHALPVTLKAADGRVLLNVTVAEVVKRPTP